jgi:hypothetical protein
MDPVRTAEIDILRYLIAHQDARDTLAGIETWWLPASKPYGVADIAAALRHLEARQLVRVWKPAFGEPVYGRYSADPGPIEKDIQGMGGSR